MTNSEENNPECRMCGNPCMEETELWAWEVLGPELSLRCLQPDSLNFSFFLCTPLTTQGCHRDETRDADGHSLSLVAQMVKDLPAVLGTWVWSLGREDPLEEEMATHSSILAWEIPWTEESGGLQSMGSPRVGHVWATNASTREGRAHGAMLQPLLGHLLLHLLLWCCAHHQSAGQFVNLAS